MVSTVLKWHVYDHLDKNKNRTLDEICYDLDMGRKKVKRILKCLLKDEMITESDGRYKSQNMEVFNKWNDLFSSDNKPPMEEYT